MPITRPGGRRQAHPPGQSAASVHSSPTTPSSSLSVAGAGRQVLTMVPVVSESPRCTCNPRGNRPSWRTWRSTACRRGRDRPGRPDRRRRRHTARWSYRARCSSRRARPRRRENAAAGDLHRAHPGPHSVSGAARLARRVVGKCPPAAVPESIVIMPLSTPASDPATGALVVVAAGREQHRDESYARSSLKSIGVPALHVPLGALTGALGRS